MKKTLLSLLPLVLAAGLAGAAVPAKKATMKAAPAVKTHTLQAEVVAADATAKTLTVKGKKENEVMPVASQAEASLATLKPGEKVKLTYQDNAQGEHLVVKIRAAAVAKHASAKKSAPKAAASSLAVK